MDPAEFHKRAASYITAIGAEQEKQLKEFLVLDYNSRILTELGYLDLCLGTV